MGLSGKKGEQRGVPSYVTDYQLYDIYERRAGPTGAGACLSDINYTYAPSWDY